MAFNRIVTEAYIQKKKISLGLICLGQRPPAPPPPCHPQLTKIISCPFRTIELSRESKCICIISINTTFLQLINISETAQQDSMQIFPLPVSNCRILHAASNKQFNHRPEENNYKRTSTQEVRSQYRYLHAETFNPFNPNFFPDMKIYKGCIISNPLK